MAKTAATAQKKLQGIQFNIEQEASTVTLGDDKVVVTADGAKVTAHTSKGVEVVAATAEEKTQISISADFNKVVLNGVAIEKAADGHLVITAPRATVIHQPAPANDTSPIALLAGAKMADGSVYAGLTPDGKYQIFAAPKDLDVTMTFNDAAKAVKKLADEKYLGKSDWQIGSLAVVRTLYKNQNEGALKGTFKTSGGSGLDNPRWSWSSTEYHGNPSLVHDVRFSDGFEGWYHRDNGRLSCRPVRLVAPSAPSPAR